MKLNVLFLVALILIITSCSDSGEVKPPVEIPGFERTPMLVNWADNIIIPSYLDFSNKMADLSASFEQFRSEVSEDNLIALRKAWLNAYRAWQHIDMFEIGPAEAVGLRLQINGYPTDVTKIESNVSTGDYDLNLPSSRTQKGFPALDYLINGLGKTDVEMAEILSGSSEQGSYTDYIKDIIGNMQELSSLVLSEWQNDYRNNFVNNDGSSATASVDRFVNDYIFYLEKFLRAGKMGIPLGVFSGSVLPGNLEAYYKGDVSKELFLEGLNSAQDFFNGKHFGSDKKGASLGSYLDTLNTFKNGEDLNKIINDQFNTAREKVAALGSFRTEIENNDPPVNMLLAYDEVQRIVPLLKVDMVSAMNISIAYVDNDGD